MKVGLMYANAGPFAYPDMLTHLATTAERVGVESLWAVEHVVIPVGPDGVTKGLERLGSLIARGQ